MRQYLAMDIGCIECGEDSAVIGLFESQRDAWAALQRVAEEQDGEFYSESGSYFSHGQHRLEVFEIEVGVPMSHELSV